MHSVSLPSLVVSGGSPAIMSNLSPIAEVSHNDVHSLTRPICVAVCRVRRSESSRERSVKRSLTDGFIYHLIWTKVKEQKQRKIYFITQEDLDQVNSHSHSLEYGHVLLFGRRVLAGIWTYSKVSFEGTNYMWPDDGAKWKHTKVIKAHYAV